MTGGLCVPQGFAWRSVRHCPTENRRRRMLVVAFVWYPPTITCLGCGDAWSEGGHLVRPFARAWRRAATARARTQWTAATTRPQAMKALTTAIYQEVRSFQDSADITPGGST